MNNVAPSDSASTPCDPCAWLLAELLAEHQVIIQVVDCLTEIAHQIMGSPRPFAAAVARWNSTLAEDAQSVLQFLQRFVDQIHHGKEEAVLFPVMEACATCYQPVQVMRREHQAARQLHQAMVGAWAENDPGGFAYEAERYVELLRRHIDQEGLCLFPLARTQVGAGEKSQLAQSLVLFRLPDVEEIAYRDLIHQADMLAIRYMVPRATADPAIRSLLLASDQAVTACISASKTRPGDMP